MVRDLLSFDIDSKGIAKDAISFSLTKNEECGLNLKLNKCLVAAGCQSLLFVSQLKVARVQTSPLSSRGSSLFRVRKEIVVLYAG